MPMPIPLPFASMASSPVALAASSHKRKPVRSACSTCAAAHLSCSDVRPCERCERRGLPCFERERKRRRVDGVGQSVLPPLMPMPLQHQHQYTPPPSWPIADAMAAPLVPSESPDVHSRSLAILSAYRHARATDLVHYPDTLPPPPSAPTSQPPSGTGANTHVTVAASSSGAEFHILNTDHPFFCSPTMMEWGLGMPSSASLPEAPPLPSPPSLPSPSPSPSQSQYQSQTHSQSFSFSPLEALMALGQVPLDSFHNSS